MAKFKNVSGEDLLVGPLDHRLVLDGAVIEISDELAETYVWTAPFWAPVSKPAKGNDTPAED